MTKSRVGRNELVLSGKKFQRVRENFNCAKCGFSVVGTGYTNHCPRCLWSKHVDIYPGDRKSNCQGYMEPVDVEIFGNNTIKLLNRCVRCGFVNNNKISSSDDFNAILQILNLKNTQTPPASKPSSRHQ